MMLRLLSLCVSLVLAWGALAQSRQIVNVGTTPNDGTGDPFRTAIIKLNANDSNLWNQAFVTQVATNVGLGAAVAKRVVSVASMAELRTINVDDYPAGTIFSVASYYGDGNGGGGDYVATNTIAGTNAWGGRILALGGSKSLHLVMRDINVRQFGVFPGIDCTDQMQSAVDFAEAFGITTLQIPSAQTSYRWRSIVVHRVSLEGDASPGWYNGTILEQAIGATNHFIRFETEPPSAPRYYAPTAGPNPGIKRCTMIGHYNANIRMPRSITAVSSRLQFTVATADLPVYTVSTASYPWFGHVFFYTAQNKYAGFGIASNINYTTGQITLATGTDLYATDANAGGVLTNTWKVVFSPQVTEAAGFSTDTFIDPSGAGYCGIYVTSSNASGNSSWFTAEDLLICSFHTAIRLGNVLLPQIRNVQTKFCAFAGFAEGVPGQTRDGDIDNYFVFGKYIDNYAANEGGVDETITLDNSALRWNAYGFYGLQASGTADKLAVNFTTVGAFLQNQISTRIGNLLLEGITSRSLWLDGSKFGNNNDHIMIDYLRFRTFQTDQAPTGFPTLPGMTCTALYYQNTQSGAANLAVGVTSLNWLASVNRKFDFGVDLVSTDGQISLGLLTETNGCDSFYGPGAGRLTTFQTLNDGGVSGTTVHAPTFQHKGITFLKGPNAGNLLRMTRDDVPSLEANFNLGASQGNWTGTGLVGWSFESSGGVLLRDTDAIKSSFIRSLSQDGVNFVSAIEPNYQGTEYVLNIGGGSANAFSDTTVNFWAAPTTNTPTGTVMGRLTHTGWRLQRGVAGLPSADALLRLDSTDQGFLQPRMTSTQRNAIASPNNGLSVYDDTRAKPATFVSRWFEDALTLTGSATYDPPSIANGGSTTTTVSVVGAGAGWQGIAAHSSHTTQGLVLYAYGSAADTMTVVLFNPSGAPVDLSSGTLRVTAFKE